MFLLLICQYRWWLQLQGLQREFSLVSAQNRGSKTFLRLSFNSLAFGTPSFSAPGRTICSIPPLVLTKPCGNECVCVCVCACACVRSVAQSCPTFSDLMDCSSARFLCPWDCPGKNTGVGCHFLLQRIFLTQGLNPGLLHWQVNSLSLNHLGSQ